MVQTEATLSPCQMVRMALCPTEREGAREARVAAVEQQRTAMALLKMGVRSTWKATPQHCGACGVACLGTQCTSGTCDPLLLAAGQLNPNGITLHADRAYWVTPGNGDVASCSVGGCKGTPSLLANSGPGGPFFIVADESHAYWNDNKAGAIWRCPLSGCKPGTVPWLSTATISSLTQPTEMAQDADFVYWHSQAGIVHRAEKNSGAVDVLVSGLAGNGAVASNGTHLAWSDFTAKTLNLCTLPACSDAEVIVANAAVQSALAVDASHVYFGTSAGSLIVGRVGIQDSKTATLTSETTKIEDLAVHAGYVYFIEGTSSGRLARVDAAGGTLELIASNLKDPAGLAVLGNHIAVTLDGTGEIWRYTVPPNKSSTQ